MTHNHYSNQRNQRIHIFQDTESLHIPNETNDIIYSRSRNHYTVQRNQRTLVFENTESLHNTTQLNGFLYFQNTYTIIQLGETNVKVEGHTVLYNL